MDAAFYWQVFLETGAPEMYLLYTNAKKVEDSYAPENTGFGTPGSTLQG